MNEIFRGVVVEHRRLNNEYSNSPRGLLNGFLLLLVSFFFFAPTSEAVSVVEVGVGSAEYGNIGQSVQELRTIAIANLLEVAVIRVSGVIISGEKSQTLRSAESYGIAASEITEKLKHDEVFHSTIVSRTNSYAKITRIIKEWREGDTYYIRAEVDVRDEKVKGMLKDNGIYWERVGSPSVRLQSNKRVNGRSYGENQNLVKALKNALSKNGILVNVGGQEATYLVRIETDFSVGSSREYGNVVHTANCSTSYELVDLGVEKSIASGSKSIGPVAGFTRNEAQSQCERKIVPRVSLALKRLLADALKDLWSNGRDYLIQIDNVRGQDVAKVANTVRQIFRVTNLSGLKYKGKSVSAEVKYKGTPFEFVDNLIKTFDFKSMPISLEEVAENVIHLKFTYLR